MRNAVLSLSESEWGQRVCAHTSLILYCPGQELMSGKAVKECVTTAYTRVPSKSKLLASELQIRKPLFKSSIIVTT